MTYADLVQTLGWRLGDRDDMAERIAAELPFLQEHVLEAQPWYPWFLFQEDSSLVTVAGERKVSLPEGFLSEVEEGALYITLVYGDIPLLKLDFDKAAAGYPGEGTPRVYAIRGEQLFLFPCPDEVWGLTLNFYKRDVNMVTSAGTSGWLRNAGDLVLAELGKLIAGKHLKDSAAEASFSADATAAWDRLYRTHIARMEQNLSRTMGD